MPGFKAKFSVPSSQSLNASGLREKQHIESHAKEMINTNTCVASNEISGTQDDSVMNENDQDLTETYNAQETVITSKPSIEPNAPTVDDIDVCSKGLTDAEYDDIFDTVIAKAAAGALCVHDKVEAQPDPGQAAEQFSARTSNISPVNLQNQNEVTPHTSPQDEVFSPPKLLLQRPVKKHGRDVGSKFHKRKTLDYVASNSAEVLGGKVSKPSRKMKEQRRKSDTDVITHRKKVLNKGVWVQCGERTCLKWRYLRHVADPSVLPNFWSCSMNKEDKSQNNCEAPEIDWTSCLSSSQDHFVYTEYNAGSIVWAKMAGYPPWPAMVDSDPDMNLFYEYDHRGRVSHYHVVFLDDNVSRAWIGWRSIEPYTKTLSHQLDQHKKCNYRAELNSAVARADEAIDLPLEERLEKYSFEKRYIANRKHEVWAPKRLSHKPHKSTKKDVASKDHQVVPTPDGPSPAQLLRSVHYVEETSSDSYWASASDGERTMAKTDKEKNSSKPNSKSKKAKPPTKSSSVGDQLPNAAKAPFIPSFKPPCRTPGGNKPDETTTAVVPTSPSSSDVAGPTLPPATGEDRMTFDPDVFTMEIDGPEKDGTEMQVSCCDEADTKIGDEVMNQGGVDEEEPLNLSLKYNTADEVQNHESPTLNDDLLADGFWDAPEKEHDKSGPLEEPFDGLGGKMFGDWDEEERLKHLDELMPVITENF